MSKIRFAKSAVGEFEKEYGYSFETQQSTQTTLSSGIQLGRLSFRKAAEHLIRSTNNPHHLISSLDKKLGPVDFSLFVINEEINKIMKKKEHWPEKILPMVTSPFYFWSREAVEKNNPQGVIRDDTATLEVSMPSNQILRFAGTGGDFCGILEGGIVMTKPEMRPVIAPTFPGPKNPVPRYEYANLEILLNTEGIESNIYPIPNPTLDYTFSLNPKIIRTDGIALRATGESIRLSVNDSAHTKLRGEVFIYLGRNFKELDSSQRLLHHVWLFMIENML